MAWTMSACPRGIIALRDQVTDWCRFSDIQAQIGGGSWLPVGAGILHLSVVVALAISAWETVGWPLAALAMATSVALCAAVLQLSLAPRPAVGNAAVGAAALATRLGRHDAHAGYTRDVSSLVAHISHELRTPLNAVIGFSDLMQRELLGPLGSARYREYAGIIRDSGHTLLKAAEDTLALATLSADPHAMPAAGVDLAATVREALRASRTDAEQRGVALSMRAPAGSQVSAAPHALRQAVVSLVAGAVGSLKSGGSVLVETVERSGHLELSVTLTRGAERAADGAVRNAAHQATGPFQISLAHTLFGLLGSHLHTGLGVDGRWRAIVELPRAMPGVARAA